MKWGYNWELGPFEIWDALGVRETTERLKKEGRAVPKIVEDLLAAGRSAFYEQRNGDRFFFDLAGAITSRNRRLPRRFTCRGCMATQGGALKTLARACWIWAMALPAWSFTRR